MGVDFGTGSGYDGPPVTLDFRNRFTGGDGPRMLTLVQAFSKRHPTSRCAWKDARYWCYGVSFAVADHPCVLQTVPGRVLGPGHNSIVTGPGGADWIVYHARDAQRTARRMWIDRLRWGPEGPERSGPTEGPQPLP
jgi:hypothetical protein